MSPIVQTVVWHIAADTKEVKMLTLNLDALGVDARMIVQVVHYKML